MADNNDFYKTLFSLIPIGLGIADMQGNLIDFNDAIMTPGGYTREDIRQIGNVAKLYFNTADRGRVLGMAQKDGFVDKAEVQFKKKDGTAYYTLLSLRPITFENKPCWLAIVEDISDEKQLQQKEKEHMKELETVNSALLGREMRIIELKKELEKLQQDENKSEVTSSGSKQ